MIKACERTPMTRSARDRDKAIIPLILDLGMRAFGVAGGLSLFQSDLTPISNLILTSGLWRLHWQRFCNGFVIVCKRFFAAGSLYH